MQLQLLQEAAAAAAAGHCAIRTTHDEFTSSLLCCVHIVIQVVCHLMLVAM